MEEKDRQLQQGIEANTNQISELDGIAREHTQKLGTLEKDLKSTDEKALQAMSVGQGAQSTANQAAARVVSLDQQFRNRNQYRSLAEESIPFAFGSSTISRAHLATLGEVAGQVKSNPDAIILLEGRTDNVGNAGYNIRLGEQRLDAVLRYLVVEQSVPMHQIYKISFGEDKPIASNGTAEGRAQNRAVLVRIMTPNAGSSPSRQMVSQGASSR
jgi:outer membrane protein OmpA-like peptidoglycan-associated protein